MLRAADLAALPARIPTPPPTSSPTTEPTPSPTVTAQIPGLGKVVPNATPTGPAPDPIGDATAVISRLVHEGPRAVLDAIGELIGAIASNMAWFVAVVVIAVLVRLVALRMVNRLTAQLSGPGPAKGPVRRALARASRRRTDARQDSLGMPLVGASLSALVERRRQRARAIGSLMKSLISGGIVAVVLTTVVAKVGIPGGALFSAGLITLTLAVLIQGVVRDVIGGIWLLFEDAYGVGDYVDAGFGAVGIVEEIGLRTTKLRGPDGTVWRVRHSELPRLGNRTQQQTMLMLDVTVEFPAPANPAGAELPAAPQLVGARELRRAERLIRASLDRLDRDLSAARRAAHGVESTTTPVSNTLAALVPDLVPSATNADLRPLDQIDSPALEDTQPMDGLAELLEELLEDADVPVLTATGIVGLAGATSSSVTLRVCGTVADTSRAQALSVLRRRLFLDVTADGLAVAFAPVDPAEI